ncbi:DUF2946 family protein [Geminicoccus roseus]|uniref:DUF2946 family protein n=1 Tax=Geminicoccus roseus TaxID=404900 RepID=UPI00041ECC76|nr:DUF2946 family protein [Geminicoccus roseus]
MRSLWKSNSHGGRRRLTAWAAMWLFGLQLLLAAAVGSTMPASATASGLFVPICANGELGWVDPAGLPGPGKDHSKKTPQDCAPCCPHGQAAFVPPSAPRLLSRQGCIVERAVLARQAVRAERSAAALPPSRAPPSSQA